MYESARHKVIAKSMDKSRRPAALPDEAVVTKLKYFVTSRLKMLTSEPALSVENYVLLQSLVVCRLILFNGRRGEEPALSVENYVLLQSLVVCHLILFNGRRGEEPALSVENYVLLQSLVVCRLTQFNGRHGEEPSHWWCAGSHCSMADVVRNPVIGGGVPAHTVQW